MSIASQSVPADGYGKYHYTLQECRDGLKRNMAEFGERYTLLGIAFELLDTTQENQELVRRWFDLYMRVIDEQSYLEFGHEMEELKSRIISAKERSEKSSS